MTSCSDNKHIPKQNRRQRRDIANRGGGEMSSTKMKNYRYTYVQKVPNNK